MDIDRSIYRLQGVQSRKMSMAMKAAMAVAALLFPSQTDAFVSPSAFTVTCLDKGIRAAALPRASGAIRNRPTMKVIDVREE